MRISRLFGVTAFLFQGLHGITLAENLVRGVRGGTIEQAINEASDLDGDFWDRFLQTQNSIPSSSPSASPTILPSNDQSSTPSASPSDGSSAVPSASPTVVPVVSGSPTTAPVATTTPAPSTTPSVVDESASPTVAPVAVSTPNPTGVPAIPSDSPTTAPIADTAAPTAVTGTPTTAPTTATASPTAAPIATQSPTAAPVATPSPTSAPMATPSPTSAPVATPSPTATPVATPSPTTAPTPEPQAPVVQQRLLPFALQAGSEFDDPESYQSKAVARTEEQIGVEGFTDAKLVQYYTLYCIYNATNGVPNPITEANPDFANRTFPEWLFATGWETNNLDPCDGWFGVTCDAEGRVTDFTMVDNLMTGSFPPEIVLLASDGPRATGAGNLNYLELFNNPFLFNNFDNSWMTELGSNLRE